MLLLFRVSLAEGVQVFAHSQHRQSRLGFEGPAFHHSGNVRTDNLKQEIQSYDESKVGVTIGCSPSPFVCILKTFTNASSMKYLDEVV